MITRYYSDIEKLLEPNRVLLLYGPRRVGKTTILNDFLKKTKLKYKLDNGENINVAQILSSSDFTKIIPHVQNYDLYAIDEAQKVPKIGQGLKIIVDQIPKIKVIATGSSSFELSGQVGEPLTGRKNTIKIFPLSQMELLKTVTNRSELMEKLPEYLIYGSYPEIATLKNQQNRQVKLKEIVESYLLKDILELEKVKGSKVLVDLLRLVAFQIGSEVSLTELGNRLGLDKNTVSRYLDLLEKTFILYNLRGLSRNLRKEIMKKSKYYFWDNGIRNALISNFNPLEVRDDIGRLWENFMVIERLKKQEYRQIYANNYFWRTWDNKEIDFVEEREGKYFGYEFKYSPGKKSSHGKYFQEIYPNGSVETVTRDNYLSFVS